MMNDGQLVRLFAIGRPTGESRMLEIRRNDNGVTALVDNSEAVWAVRGNDGDNEVVGMKFFVENVSTGEKLGEFLAEHCDYWYNGEVYWDTAKDLTGVHSFTEDSSRIEEIDEENWGIGE